jgi:PKD repeat protein
VFVGFYPPPWDCFNFFTYVVEDSSTVTFTGEAYYQGIIVQADSYTWDFGDGTTGDGQIVTHIYDPNGPDMFMVCLTTVVTDSVTGETCEAISCQEVWLGNQPDCQAMFIYFPLDSLNRDLTYQFLDVSWGNHDTWLWEFGDGTSSTLQNPVHLFADTGVYNVCLTIWDSAGTCQSTYCDEVFVGFYPPPWDCFNFFTYVVEDSSTVTFTGEASYTWDFGDGTTGDGQTVTHIYDPNGPDVFMVCLTTVVTDSVTGETCEAISCDEVWLGNQPDCQAMFIYFPLDSLNRDLTYQFLDVSWGNHDTWLWEFGDGTSSTLQNPVHLFADTGVYNVCLTIWDSEGTCQSTYCDEVFVGFFPPPWDCFNFFTYVVEDSSTVTFTGEAYYAGMIVQADSYTWDFGDGTTGDGQTVTHIYDPNGPDTYFVCLTTVFTDSVTGETCEAISCEEVWLENQFDCQAMFIYYPLDSLNRDLTYQFLDVSWGNHDTWLWEFGDGTSSTLQNPVHLFADTGIYNVCLTIWDSEGPCQSTNCMDVFIGFFPPPWNCCNIFTYVVEDSSTVTFTGEAYYAGMIVQADSYTWDFGDGTTGDGQTVTHIYDPNGPDVYTVCLTTVITDSVTGETCTAVSCQDVMVGGMAYFDLFGQVTMENSFVDMGMATLYQIDPITGDVFLIDLQPIDSSGYYFFFDIMGGDYLILAELMQGSTGYGEYLPTYYGDVLYWGDATVISLGEPENPYNINLIPMSSYENGVADITGIITQGNRLFGDGTPVTDVEIILLNESNIALDYRYSSEDGEFDFSTLAYGTYKVYAEVPGKSTTPALVILDENNQSATLEFEVTEGAIYILSVSDLANPTYTIGEIFPNPVTDHAYVHVNLTASTLVEINIFNQMGQQVFSEMHNLEIGSHKIALNTDGLIKGVFVFRINTFNGPATVRKFIKIE